MSSSPRGLTRRKHSLGCPCVCVCVVRSTPFLLTRLPLPPTPSNPLSVFRSLVRIIQRSAPPACELLSSSCAVLYSQASYQVSEPSFCEIVKGLIHKERDGAVISLDLECGVENLTAPE